MTAIGLDPHRVRFLVVHCSATRATSHYSPAQLDRDHRSRGFDGTGYHYYITRDGALHHTRDPSRQGAHARGYNSCSLGICYEGGLDSQGHPADTRTEPQKATLIALLARLLALHPHAVIVGHRELPGVSKDCPCFDCSELRRLFHQAPPLF